MENGDAKARWSSRKFWAAMFWMAVFTGLLVLDMLPADAYVTLALVVLGAYFASNVYQHVHKVRQP